MSYLTGRVISTELMDDPNIDREELRRGLAHLERLNRSFGGAKALIRSLDQWTRDWPEGASVRLLDVGTGLADIPLAIINWATQRGMTVAITATDIHETTLDLAREYIGNCPAIHVQRVDARELTDCFDPGSFDIVHASMVLHHLEDIEVITVLRMMDRLATRGVVWNDLVRSTLSRLLAGLNFTVPRWVRQDAVASVRAGFTAREAVELAARAGWDKPRYRTHMGYRFTLTREQ